MTLNKINIMGSRLTAMSIQKRSALSTWIKKGKGPKYIELTLDQDKTFNLYIKDFSNKKISMLKGNWKIVLYNQLILRPIDKSTTKDVTLQIVNSLGKIYINWNGVLLYKTKMTKLKGNAAVV